MEPIQPGELGFSFELNHITLEGFARRLMDGPEFALLDWEDDFGLVYHAYVKSIYENGKHCVYPCPANDEAGYSVTLVEGPLMWKSVESIPVDVSDWTGITKLWHRLFGHKPEMIDSLPLTFEKWGWKKLGDLPTRCYCKLCGKDKIETDLHPGDYKGEPVCKVCAALHNANAERN